ncbi:MAG TPA: ATP-binding protein, partial [Ktedonobacteraceae bacterium]|nr:ATP-binding protein [Ktedonobacteraceae bacterium]
KTNTVFHLLKQAWAAKVPFLVIEPVKTEYRALLHDASIANDVRLFTLGDENISPFRLNPFEVLSGTPISVHLDLLRSAFNASFGMWAPLPQVLEQCLHRIYEDRGWDIARSTNYRLDAGADATDAFPTLSDLVAKVDEVTQKLGYEDKITADIRAALHTRLNALRAGGKGFMLDVQRSLPMRELLEHPTILELERMGDDDDRAFMMGLLLIRLAEYRRVSGKANGLKHVLVIEEAHRLLTNVGQRQSEEESNPRGKAVEAFANLLSEIRAYGQGVIVADQVPVKLAPDVIKNTNLKIAHRIVAEDDRTALAGSMVMNERQKKMLATLSPGQAIMFSEGDDAPMLVQVPPTKDDAKPWPDRKQIMQHMAATKALQGYQSVFLQFPSCASTCSTKGQACQVAQQIVEDAAFQATFARTILSTIEDTGALDRMWHDLCSVVQARRPPRSDEQSLLRCVLIRASYWFADRRGAQAGWSYAQTRMLAEKLYHMLLARLNPTANSDLTRNQFQHYARTLHARHYPPFPACELICQQKPPVCLYRYAVADLITTGKHSAMWRNADANDHSSPDQRRNQCWEVAQNAGYDLIEFPEINWTDEALTQRVGNAARRACLCFAQQMLSGDESKIPRTNRIILMKLQREAQS